MEKIYDYDNFIEKIKVRLRHDETFYPKITNLREYPDGKYYEGYIWDCFIDPEMIEESLLDCFVSEKEEIYVFWDNHSDYRVNIENYFRFGKRVVLKMSGKELLKLKEELPEDIYITDGGISFLAAYTHEWIPAAKSGGQMRYCLISRGGGTDK